MNSGVQTRRPHNPCTVEFRGDRRWTLRQARVPPKVDCLAQTPEPSSLTWTLRSNVQHLSSPDQLSGLQAEHFVELSYSALVVRLGVALELESGGQGLAQPP